MLYPCVYLRVLLKSFVIHPYVLGVLLGDGVLTNNLAKHINTRLYISSNEKDIIEKNC